MGRDFLARNQLGITWGPEGILQLRDSQDTQIQTMEETVTHIARLTAKVTVPSRSLTAVTVRMILPSCKNKTQEGSLSEPNCVIYPLDYATIKGGL